MFRLDAYIYDYLMAKKLHASAKAFKAERAVPNDPVGNVYTDQISVWLFCLFWSCFN